jgi:hypothetical protein
LFVRAYVRVEDGMRPAKAWWTVVALTLVAAGCSETDPGEGGSLGDGGGSANIPPVSDSGVSPIPGGGTTGGGFAGGGTTGGGFAGGGTTGAGGGTTGGGSAAGGTPSGGFIAGAMTGGGTTGGVIAGLGGGFFGGGSGGGTAGGMPVPVPTGTTCLKGSGNFAANGPYRVKQKDVTIGSQGQYTIFSPDPLETSCKHPIVAWGNGTAVTGSDTYAFYQEHAASYGIVVVASHNDNVGSGQFHTAGLDYLLKENMTQGSEFFGKLSTKAGTSGHSQGGAGANMGASHPNVEAIGNVQGAFGSAPRGAAFLCLTGTEDIATEGCKTAVNGSTSPALYANWQGGDHIGTATLLGFITGDPGTKQYQRLYTGWFRCFLADDSAACNMFKGGAECPVCKEMGWAEIFAKNM